MKTFGDRLRHARKLRGWTQKALGDASGLSQSAIGNYESDQRYSSRALMRLAAALKVSPHWLDSGQGSMEGDEAGFYPHSSGRPGGSKVEDAGAHSWPFPQIPYSHYQALSPRDKHLLERTVQAFIDSCRTAGTDRMAHAPMKTAAGSRGGK